jgi:putative pyruvate formate lyase activating enzyme
VDRTAGEIGSCKLAGEAVVASWGPHFGEEPVLVGRGGSGTIFLSGCNLHCVFCQNSDISQSLSGKEVTLAQIAAFALDLAANGCENVNFVSPSHVAHAVAEAICIARGEGLTVPIVYNTGGYDSLETLRLLDGLIEIYMPDFKWADEPHGKKYSDVPDYPKVAAAVLEEMYRQVGPVETDSRGIATRGVLVRHLVMPNDLAGSTRVIDTVARIAPGTMINVMGQYRPAHLAGGYAELMSLPSREEIHSLRTYAASRGLVLSD